MLSALTKKEKKKKRKKKKEIMLSAYILKNA
jgi:hypothetical protein